MKYESSHSKTNVFAKKHQSPKLSSPHKCSDNYHDSRSDAKGPFTRELVFLPHGNDGRISKIVANRSRIKTQPFEKVLFFAGEISDCNHSILQPQSKDSNQRTKMQQVVNYALQPACFLHAINNTQLKDFGPARIDFNRIPSNNIKKTRRIVRTSISIQELLN